MNIYRVSLSPSRSEGITAANSYFLCFPKEQTKRLKNRMQRTKKQAKKGPTGSGVLLNGLTRKKENPILYHLTVSESYSHHGQFQAIQSLNTSLQNV